MDRGKPIPASKYTPSQAWFDRQKDGDWAKHWPDEMDPEYIRAKEIPQKAPLWTALGRQHMAAVTAILVYCGLWTLAVIAIRQGWVQ